MKFTPPIPPQDSDRKALTAFKEAWTRYVEEYSYHLESLRNSLPPQIVELARLPGIDDGLIVEVIHNRSERILTIVLRCGDLQRGYFDLILTYSNAEITSLDKDILTGLASSTVDSTQFKADLSRHEIDITSEGRIEHRLEFHVYSQSNVWFAIQCQELTWKKVSRPNRNLPTSPLRFRDI